MIRIIFAGAILVLILILAQDCTCATPPELTGYMRVGSEQSFCGTQKRSYMHPNRRIVQHRWSLRGSDFLVQVVVRRGEDVYSHLWVRPLRAGKWEKITEEIVVCDLVSTTELYDVL